MRIKKYELVKKAREAMLSAVQIYNNPQITFKSETFITLAVIAWTYLLHAYYGNKGVDYRYYSTGDNGRKKYDKTKYGAYKHWELERCLNEPCCPLDKSTIGNLRFLIGIRHEIEHQMTKQIDNSISAKVLACSINFNFYIKQFFGEPFGVDQDLGLAIQFSPIEAEQKEALYNNEKILGNVKRFISSFEKNLSQIELDDTHYAYRVVFVRVDGKRKNHETDQVIRFISSDSPEAEGLKETIALIQEKEKKKFTSSQIVQMMKDEGYFWFSMGDLTSSWKELKTGRDPYGIWITKYQWMWYENWIPIVKKYCIREDSIRRLDMSENSLLPNQIVKIIQDKGYSRFNNTWLSIWESEMCIDRANPENGHYGKGGKYYWHRSIIESVLLYCSGKRERLK